MAELLSVRVYRLSGPSSDVPDNLLPVLSVQPNRLNESVMLLVSPISLSSARFVVSFGRVLDGKQILATLGGSDVDRLNFGEGLCFSPLSDCMVEI